jgi:S1-C subfamily serine protease
MSTSFPSLSLFSSELTSLVDQASAFVVSVDTRYHRPGSGLVLGPDLVVTADHLLERDHDLVVRAGDRQLAATVAGRDPATDIAVLRVAGLGGAEPPRGGEPRAGQLAISISRNPSGAVSAGIGLINSVGGPLRTGRGVVLRQVVRTDAAARPGTSGGAIFDTAGGVIAMTTTALLRGLPVGIPTSQLWEIATALASNQPLNRAYLGVSVQPVRFPKAGPEGAERGLLVSGLAKDEPADRAGLLVGDVIVQLNDARITHVDDLQDRLSTLQAGSPAALLVIRGGAKQRVDVTLGARQSA